MELGDAVKAKKVLIAGMKTVDDLISAVESLGVVPDKDMHTFFFPMWATVKTIACHLMTRCEQADIIHCLDEKNTDLSRIKIVAKSIQDQLGRLNPTDLHPMVMKYCACELSDMMRAYAQ